MDKKINSYSIDFSANKIVNTISNATPTNVKWDQTDGKDHPDYGIPLNIIPPNEGIVITPNAVFIKSLNLVIMTEDNYNKLKGKENEI